MTRDDLRVLRARDWIELAAAFDEARGLDRDPARTRAFYERLYRILGARCSRWQRRRLRSMPLHQLLALASSYQLFGSNLQALVGPSAPLRRYDRAELLAPAYRLAFLMGETLDSVLDLPFAEFMERQKIARAMLAEIKLEILPLISAPHLTDAARRELHYGLLAEARSLERPDASPWTDHMSEARRSIFGTN